ncbi:MAG: Fic family protein [Terriglobales bacterium]
MKEEEDRHSRAFEADLITDPAERAKAEARNGLRQYDTVIEMVDYWLQPGRPFKLRLSAILHLHRIALEGISSYAGNFRPAGIKIGGSKHEPVGAHVVPEKVEELCDYVNENWDRQSPIHLAGYVLWRLNWIHPFTDGNGRTARALSYLILCVRLRMRLPGTDAIPELISRDKSPYYRALEAADAAHEKGGVDLSAMERLLSDTLAKQLLSVHEAASAGPSADPARYN